MSQSRTSRNSYPAIIIGGGQAGLSLSYWLDRRGVSHLVLEKDRPFSDWYNHRWDSFAMNTPNWMNRLPGESQPFAPGAPRNDFGTLADAHEYFEAYVRAVDRPLAQEEALRVAADSDGAWHVATDRSEYRASCVVLAIGHANRPAIPALAKVASGGPPAVEQLHSSSYKRPSQIQTANVVVAGSGSSGVQICRELAASGRFDDVYLAESGNFTLPWTVLGIPSYTLMKRVGAFRINRETWLGRCMIPRLLRKGDPATPPSPRQLAREFGVQRRGKVVAVDPDAVCFASGGAVATESLTVVWCTGFRPKYDLLDKGLREVVLDRDGRPKHRRGVATTAAGLYFLGLRFQHSVVSQDLYGVGADACYLAGEIARRAAAVCD